MGKELARQGFSLPKYTITIQGSTLGTWDKYFTDQMMQHWNATMAVESKTSIETQTTLDTDPQGSAQPVIFSTSASTPVQQENANLRSANKPAIEAHPNPIQHVQERLDAITISINAGELKNYAIEFQEILSFIKTYAKQIEQKDMHDFTRQVNQMSIQATALFASGMQRMISVSTEFLSCSDNHDQFKVPTPQTVVPTPPEGSDQPLKIKIDNQ